MRLDTLGRDYGFVPPGMFAVDPQALEAARRGVPTGEYHDE